MNQWEPDTRPLQDNLILPEIMNNNTNNNNKNYDKPVSIWSIVRRYRLESSLEDLRSIMFWKSLFAEFFGTFFLVLVALGSTIQTWHTPEPDMVEIVELDIVQIALSFGLCASLIIIVIGHISGGHINPAVTMAMLVTRRISLVRAVLYIVVQCVGSVAGAALLKCMTPSTRLGGLGSTILNVGVTPGMAFGIEFLITMMLVLTVFATFTENDVTGRRESFALIIGMSVCMGHSWAVEFCGSSMNPARTFGPAVIMNIWTDHWVYWFGPILGGISAGLLYDNFLATSASLAKLRDLLMAPQFDAEDYKRGKHVYRVVEENRTQDIMPLVTANADPINLH